jgi:hypothetical protein
MRKRVALRDGTIKVHYRLENRGVKSCNLVLEVENELCPDALTLLNGGRAAGMWGGHTESAAPTIETWGVINRPAGSAVRVETSNPPDEITGEVVIGALVLRYGFSRTLTPGETWDISLLARIVQLKALQSV